VANTEVERHTGSNIPDVEDVPSAEWGWSKENYKWIHIGGLLSAGFLLLMLRGKPRRSHRGRVSDLLRGPARFRGRA